MKAHLYDLCVNGYNVAIIAFTCGFAAGIALCIAIVIGTIRETRKMDIRRKL